MNFFFQEQVSYLLVTFRSCRRLKTKKLITPIWRIAAIPENNNPIFFPTLILLSRCRSGGGGGGGLWRPDLVCLRGGGADLFLLESFFKLCCFSELGAGVGGGENGDGGGGDPGGGGGGDSGGGGVKSVDSPFCGDCDATRRAKTETNKPNTTGTKLDNGGSMKSQISNSNLGFANHRFFFPEIIFISDSSSPNQNENKKRRSSSDVSDVTQS